MTILEILKIYKPRISTGKNPSDLHLLFKIILNKAEVIFL